MTRRRYFLRREVLHAGAVFAGLLITGKVLEAAARKSQETPSYKFVNDLQPGDPFSNLSYWINGEQKFLSRFVAARYENQNQFLREGTEAGRVWINTPNTSSPATLDLELNAQFENEMRQNQATSGIFVNTAWPRVTLKLYDLSDPSNPRLAAQTTTDGTGFGGVVLGDKNRRMRVAIERPFSQTNSIDVWFGAISQTDFQAILSGQRPHILNAPALIPELAPTPTPTPSATPTVAPVPSPISRRGIFIPFTARD